MRAWLEIDKKNVVGIHC